MPEGGWTRRRFLGAVAVAGAATAFPVSPGLSRRFTGTTADDVFRVGLVVPGTGPLSEAGETAVLGAELGAAEAAHLAELLEKRFELHTVRAAGPEAAERGARRLIEQEGVFAIAGGFGLAACLALSELADRRGVLFFNIGCSDDVLRGERCRRTTFNVEASTAMYVDALAQWLVGEAGLRRWHFVTPASEAGTATYRRGRRALLEQGGEDLGNTVVRPGALDHAALLEELRQAQPDVAFLALKGASRTAFLTQYSRLGPPFEVTGLFPGAVQLWLTAPETRAGIWPILWHHELFRYGAEQLGARFRDRFDRPLEARAWASWLAVKILAETVLRTGTTETSELVRFLEQGGTQFDGHKGKKLTFRPWDHQLRQPLYLVRAKRKVQNRWDVIEGVAELPLGRPDSRRTSKTFLDQLGDRQTETGCRFGRP